MRQPASLFAPASDWFELSGHAGRGFDTRRDDAIRLEAILANSGDLDLTATDGPTGYWGTGLDTALRRYQKRNGLKVDGWLRPGGPTIAHMRESLGPVLDGFARPSPDEIDAHHESLEAGEGPLVAISPRTELSPIPGLPDIGEAGRGSNVGQIDWLLRNQTGLGTVPTQFARYVTGLGDEGLAQARDFVAQYAARRPADNDALVAGILRELPDDDSRSRFLGRKPGGIVPAGIRTMDYREDRDGVPQMRNLLLRDDSTADAAPAADRDESDGASDPQTAQAPVPTPAKPGWYNDIPAYRADVFADKKQNDAWNAMRDTLAGNAQMGEGQRAAYMSIFAAEGGMKTDDKSGAVAGLMPGFIEGERKAGRWPAELDHVKTPADLKPAEVPRAMQHYFDTNLAKIGGAKALDTIPDPRVAAAIADTLYRDGPGKGAQMVQTAIEKAGGPKDIDSVFGSRTLDAVRNLSADPDGARRLLDGLLYQKERWHENESGRNRHYRF